MGITLSLLGSGRQVLFGSSPTPSQPPEMMREERCEYLVWEEKTAPRDLTSQKPSEEDSPVREALPQAVGPPEPRRLADIQYQEYRPRKHELSSCWALPLTVLHRH